MKDEADPRRLTNHHIVPASRGGSSKPTNFKRVPYNVHVAFHQVFLNLTPEEVHEYLEEVWFDPEKSFIRPEEWLERKRFG